MVFKQSVPGPEMSSGGDKPREQASATQPTKSNSGKTQQKGITILLNILIAVFVVISIFLFIGKSQLQGENKKLASELTSAKARMTALQKQADEAVAIKQKLQADLTQAQQQAKAISAQLAMEKKAKEKAIAKLDSAIKQNKSFKTALENTKKAKENLETMFNRKDEENKRLNLQLTQLRKTKESLEKRLKGTFKRRGVELEKIVVKPETEEVITEGQVLVVNREFDFIVVNLGENDGLQIGSKLQVVKDTNVLGEVEVEKIYGNMSAATILPETDKKKIREGCKVRLL